MRVSGFLLFIAALILAAAPSRAAEKELRMAVLSGPPTLGNPFTGIGPPSNFIWDALFDPLVKPGPDGEVQPVLALSWEVVEPTRWRFTLRPGVTFSNGEPFNAAAAAATLNWLRGEGGQRLLVGAEAAGVTAVEVVDDLTLDVVTATPDAILPKRLTAVSIVAPKAWAELGPEGFAKTPVGTGPFTLQTWADSGGRMILAANRASWRPPVIDRIVFLPVPDAIARVQALISGQVDLITPMSPEDAVQFEGTDFTIVTAMTPQVYSLAFNVVRDPKSPIADARVRRALNYAVNKDAISEVVMHGMMKPASQGATSLTFGYNPALEPYPHDPARARALLAEAGYPKGFKLNVEAVTGAIAGDATMLQLIQQDLRAVGVDATFRTTTFADWLRRYSSGTIESDVFGLSWNGAPYLDAVRAMQYFSCDKPQPFFCDESVMPALAATAVEFDVEKRRRMLQDLAAVYRDLAPAIFLIATADIGVASPAVRNFRVQNRVPVYEALDIVRD